MATLIQLNDSLIVSPSQILKAHREGKTVYVTLCDESLPIEAWDDEGEIWSALVAETK